MLDPLVNCSRLLVRQVKEWSEILLGYEARNRYEVVDERGELVARVAEEGSGFGRWIGRQLLGHCRAATLHVLALDGRELARIEKPFRWFFQEVTLVEEGRFAGRIVRQLRWFKIGFAMHDASGAELLTIERGFLDRLRFSGTFRVSMQGHEVALIRKEWRGLLTEWFTDADHFGIEFTEPELDPAVRKLLFAATFLIDFTCFENNQRSGSGFDLFNWS